MAIAMAEMTKVGRVTQEHGQFKRIIARLSWVSIDVEEMDDVYNLNQFPANLH
jgi:hypothetical protein